jgi:Leucine-rich repeat (LRR) protein
MKMTLMLNLENIYLKKSMKISLKNKYKFSITQIFISCLFIGLLSGFFTAQGQSKLLNEEELDKEHMYLSLNTALKNPTKVYKLNLSRQNLTTIPAEVYSFVNLQRLDMSYNNLTEVPKEIGILKNLQSFDFTKNKLTNLPATIALLTHLEEILIGNNQFVTIPLSITQLKKLELLEIDDNKIPKSEITKFKKLLPKCELIFE